MRRSKSDKFASTTSITEVYNQNFTRNKSFSPLDVQSCNLSKWRSTTLFISLGMRITNINLIPIYMCFLLRFYQGVIDTKCSFHLLSFRKSSLLFNFWHFEFQIEFSLCKSHMLSHSIHLLCQIVVCYPLVSFAQWNLGQDYLFPLNPSYSEMIILCINWVNCSNGH